MNHPTYHSTLNSVVLIILLGLLGPATTIAQSNPFVLFNTERIPLESELTGRAHELVVFLPPSYSDSVDKQYPVLYFTDAYWDMPLLYSIHGQLSYDNVIPEIILVGFSYAGDNPNYGDLRSRDLSPTKSERIPNAGDGPKFLEYIEQSVIPYVESNYPADPKQRALGGSSLGGLFALYVMYENPELFKRYLAISPAAMWEKDYLFHLDQEYSSKGKDLPVRLFLSAGGDEIPEFRDPIFKLQQQIENQQYQNFALLNYTIEGSRHAGVKAEGYARGLKWVFKDIAPSGPSGLSRAFGN